MSDRERVERLEAVVKAAARFVASETVVNRCTGCSDTIQDDGHCSCEVGDLRAALVLGNLDVAGSQGAAIDEVTFSRQPQSIRTFHANLEGAPDA